LIEGKGGERLKVAWATRRKRASGCSAAHEVIKNAAVPWAAAAPGAP
jgi:hypothetical protein